MSVGRICRRAVVTAAPGESVYAVTKRMEEKNVGTVVMMSDQGRPVGIVTDRDVALRCVAAGLVARDTPVAEIMTRELRTIDEATPIELALQAMARAGKRRLVVIGADGKLLGILALDDIMGLLVSEASSVGALLRREAPRETAAR